MMDIWTLLWLLVVLTIFISILESIYRRIKERQLRQHELDLQRQIPEAQQYHVYTLQPLANPMQRNTPGSILTQQQQQYIHEQQELKASNDLPPKYEDVVRDTSYANRMGFAIPSSSSPQTSVTITDDSVNSTQPMRY